MTSKILILYIALLISFALAIQPQPCNVTYCGTNGPFAKCTAPYSAKLTTCYRWGATKQGLFQCRTHACPDICYEERVIASDGSEHCSPCHLHQHSCTTLYKVYGPIHSDPSTTSRSVSGTRIVEETERLSVDPPTKPILEVPTCSADFCSKNGATKFCGIYAGSKLVDLMTCLKFSQSDESKKQCSFFCPQLCLPEDQQPVASNGKKFCTECHLKQASCASSYKIFGPVRPKATPKPSPAPTSDPGPAVLCKRGFCTFRGQSGRCLYMKREITCRRWASTPEKEKECAFACIQICKSVKPIDNFGKTYCSSCHLAQASCESNFKIYGPVGFSDSNAS